MYASYESLKLILIFAVPLRTFETKNAKCSVTLILVCYYHIFQNIFLWGQTERHSDDQVSM